MTTVAEPPFGLAVQGHGLGIKFQVMEKDDEGDFVPKDISAATFVYKIRAWEKGSSAAYVTAFDNETVAKSSTAGTEGWLDDYVTCGATAYAKPLTFQLVEVDTGGTDTNTTTDDPERVLLRWTQPILEAPVP